MGIKNGMKVKRIVLGHKWHGEVHSVSGDLKKRFFVVHWTDAKTGHTKAVEVYKKGEIQLQLADGRISKYDSRERE